VRKKVTERIEPFHALMFDQTRCTPLTAVVAPPYDLIDQKRQAELYSRSPYNVVRLELNREPDPYSAAAQTLSQWLAEGILVRSSRPAIYLYTQKFEVAGRSLARTGLVVRIRLEEFASGRILPHERTFPKAKEDRLRLLTATQVNVSPIFGLYPSESQQLRNLLREISQRKPVLELMDDLGINNELRLIEAPDELRLVQEALADARILIADGHHRYETALEYRRLRHESDRDSCSVHGYDYVMMTLVAFDDPGLVILPTHRVVRHLDGGAIAAFEQVVRRHFRIEEFREADAMCAALVRSGRGTLAIALRDDCVFRLLRLKDDGVVAAALPSVPPQVRALDVSVLHAMIFEPIFHMTPEEIRKGGNIEYTIDMKAALDAVANGNADGAFLMNPPTVQDVERVSAAGSVMPEKSTYFYPKLLTGLVMNPLNG
jgi:uncharacterized protein (DUF1015 family)